MSNDQSNKKPKYFVKELGRRGGAPNWGVYERGEAGQHAVCLCYDEPTARRIMGLLADAEHGTHGPDGLQA